MTTASPVSDRENAIVNSALWAAAGDALGWITELASDEGHVRGRAGVERIIEPIAWDRLIGGRAGTKVSLPPGTYSDDTQLRLAVCRAIRGDGAFDAEAFGKIELTVWPAYALGAGRGTKAAAANLARRDVNWFSNFFSTKDQQYIRGGGNGAAMRIQPHVWVAPKSGSRPDADAKCLTDVTRDALVTHGHAHGFCGAVFHAVALRAALADRAPPSPDRWSDFVDEFLEIPSRVDEDRQLAAFWRPAWEQAVGDTLERVVSAARDEVRRDINNIRPLLDGVDSGKESSPPDKTYLLVLERLGCLEPRLRGSGLKTAIAAVALAWLFRSDSPEAALVTAANVLDSDTDTISTMAGALLGAAATAPPVWQIQDREYIEFEARRLAAIGRGEQVDSFAYPDLARWQPPANQSDAVGKFGDGFAVIGLGPAVAMSLELEPAPTVGGTNDAVWQWLQLPFKQTILSKRRRVPKITITADLLPSDRRRVTHLRLAEAGSGSVQVAGVTTANQTSSSGSANSVALSKDVSSAQRPQSSRDRPREPSLWDDMERHHRGGTKTPRRADDNSSGTANGEHLARRSSKESIDWLTDQVIQSDFDDLIMGRLFNRCIDEFASIEGPLAFAAVVAKAKLARRRRNSR